MTQGQSEHQAGLPTAPTGRLLFALLGGAGAWTLHFLGSYALAAIGCVQRWQGLREGLAVGTLALVLVAAWSTGVSWREWRRVSAGQPWDSALSEPRGWFAYLMLTGVLMGALAVLTIALEGWGTLVLPVCGWDVR
jgi:hypothetical protein